MNKERKIAIISGILYITGTLTGILSVVFSSPTLGSFAQHNADYLIKASANSGLITGALFLMAMGISLAFVSFAVYPLLKKQNQSVAMGYVVFRGAIESIIAILIAAIWLCIFALSRETLMSHQQNLSQYQSIGIILLAASDSLNNILSIVFPIGALMFYYLLLKSGLIPAWLSCWGLFGCIPYLTAGILSFYGVIQPMTTIHNVLVFPLGIQEMAMALWFIFKGFNNNALQKLLTD